MRILLCLLILHLVPLSAVAQEAPSARLITIGPGDLAHERYGHNMLHVRDPGRGIDVSFNWGVFEFDEGFILNFIQGRLWYWMDGDFAGPGRAIEFYRSQDRMVWVQELNLSADQVKGLLDLCLRDLAKLGPPNRGYRYDYYRDNCSTRVRDAVDEAVGGQIKAGATTLPSDATYHSETRRLMAGDLPLYVGLNFVLGHPTDVELSAWEEMFIPMRMRERFNELTIADASGKRIPLVRQETTLHASGHIRERATPPNWIGWFVLAGAVIGAALGWSGRAAGQGSRPGRWGFGILTILWGVLSGIAGVILAYLWFFTDHAATRPNENLLQLGPWSLLLVVLVPLAMRTKKDEGKRMKDEDASAGSSSIGVAAMILALIGLGLSMLGLVLQVLPLMSQVNGEIIGLALPAHAGLVWGMWELNRSRAIPIHRDVERSST